VTAHSAPDPETLSCAITGSYAGRWARAVDEDASAAADIWFVDAFAGADLQRAALRGTAAAPGALAALRAMAPRADRIRIVLVDEDPGLLLRLEAELERAGDGPRVRRTSDLSSVAPGEIGLVESPFAAVAARLADEVAESAALVRLAPLSARALPWTALQPIASLARTDLLLRFPGEDFHRQARITGPIADFPPHVRRLVEGCSALLGDERHGWLSAWRDTARRDGADAALEMVAGLHRELIAGAADDGRIVAVQRLGSGAESIHLLLATSDPAHALEATGVIADGGADLLPPTVAAMEPEPEPEGIEPPVALELFPVPPPVEPKPRGPDLPEPAAPAPPRKKRPRKPAAGELGLFDVPDE
jgi:three-Cys-motif partner protein